jgi:hypothetical protein
MHRRKSVCTQATTATTATTASKQAHAHAHKRTHLAQRPGLRVRNGRAVEGFCSSVDSHCYIVRTGAVGVARCSVVVSKDQHGTQQLSGADGLASEQGGRRWLVTRRRARDIHVAFPITLTLCAGKYVGKPELQHLQTRSRKEEHSALHLTAVTGEQAATSQACTYVVL